MPFRYLAGKCHEFREYRWGVADMGRVLDTLYDNMQKLSHKPTLILDESFMMDIFKPYRDELPPFQEYWDIIFKKKQMKVISRKDGSKVVHYARLLTCLFSPRREADLAATDRVHELGSIAASTIIRELLDQNKATYKYLLLSKSEFSHRYSTLARKQSLIGIRATNDEVESVLGGATANIQRYGRISLSSAGAVGDMKRNAFLHRSTKSKSKSKPLGRFHQFDPSLQEAIIIVGMTDAPDTRKCNNEDLEKQATARRIKEELIKEKGLEKATEEYIDALYYYQMYFSYLSNENKFKQRAKKARRERETRGEGSMYSQLQPFSRPELTELIGKRIDVLCSFDIDIRKGTKELRWCQGEVMEIVEGARDPTVKVKWDAQANAHGYEEETITNQR
jgi:hypothetical protein